MKHDTITIRLDENSNLTLLADVLVSANNGSEVFPICKSFFEITSDSYVTLSRLSEEYRMFEYNALMVVLDEFCSNIGATFTTPPSFSLSYRHLSPSLSKIDISLTEQKRITTYGFMFLQLRDGAKLLISVDYRSDGPYRFYDIEVYSLQKNTKCAEEFLDGWVKLSKQKNYLAGKKITPTGEFIKYNPTYTWDDVILDKNVKSSIRKNIELVLSNLDVYKRHGVGCKRGIILSGIPGVGKTLIGKVLCATSVCTIIWVTPKYLTSSSVANIFEIARELSPAILFLEDIDLYADGRETANSRQLIGELLAQFDGAVENNGIVFVATTNRKTEIETALSNRPGRFDVTIDIPLPKKQELLELFKLYLKPFSSTAVDTSKLVDEAFIRSFTPAHVKEAVDAGVITAIESRSFTSTGQISLTTEQLLNGMGAASKKVFGFGVPVKESEIIDLEDTI